MKTDVIVIYSDGSEMEEALVQAEKTAQYKGLSHKAALHLRLLTEEMLGMMRSITGNVKGRFWIEDEKGAFQLHLKVKTFVDFEKREQLLKASTSGKNEAARERSGHFSIRWMVFRSRTTPRRTGRRLILSGR